MNGNTAIITGLAVLLTFDELCYCNGRYIWADGGMMAK